ncbi:MFS family permease [Conyzicola lurida]|uniref:MFS family permease n=1 Tax=Conyzicola lurida TaxID=1172621 RepID=A0A841AJA1_9MICO|nr:MFS transporter [Conyzicola lurida]MBB5841763.1 MFS family permease [Conyzicola lurida]
MTPLATVVRTPSAVYLLGTSLVGRLPSAMAALAIVQLVRLQGGDYALAGAMTAVYIVSGAVGQPLLSRWVDRAGQTLVLVVSAVVSSLSFAAVALFAGDAPALALVGAVLAGFFAPPLEPSLRALWPRIVAPGAPLKAAFSLDAGAQEVIFIVGPLLTVLGISAFGATGNVLFAAALGLVGTVAFALNRVSRTTGASAPGTAPRRSPVTNAGFRRLVAFTFGVGVPVGVLTISVTVFGENHGVDGFAGWALAANAFGALAGATALALRPLRREPQRLLALCGLSLAVGYLPLALADLPPAVWLALAVVAGFMLPPTLAQVFETVPRVSDSGALTEANAWVVSAMSVGVAAGTLGGGLVAGIDAAVPVMVLCGSALTAALALLVLPSRMRPVAEPAAVAEPVEATSLPESSQA